MAFIDTIQPSQATGKVHEMYALQQDHWGFVPNYSKLFGHRTEVLSRWGRLLAEIKRPVSNRWYELITFVVARELEHSSCSLVHGNALAEMIGTDAVADLAKCKIPDVLTDVEKALVTFSLEIARDTTGITDDKVADLKCRHGLSDEDIFDVVAIAAARCFFTKLTDALGAEPDKAMGLVDERLREVITYGRPVSSEEVEKISLYDETVLTSDNNKQEEKSHVA